MRSRRSGWRPSAGLVFRHSSDAVAFIHSWCLRISAGLQHEQRVGPSHFASVGDDANTGKHRRQLDLGDRFIQPREFFRDNYRRHLSERSGYFGIVEYFRESMRQDRKYRGNDERYFGYSNLE